jgi:SAM-dependent methyltransferase
MNRLRRIMHQLRHRDSRWWMNSLRDRISPAHLCMSVRLASAVSGARGLEVGGPTRLFGPRGSIPLYSWAASFDNVNFSDTTEWSSAGGRRGAFVYARKTTPGTLFIAEAADLAPIPTASYDLIASSHCLEHVANPLRALRQWRRVGTDEGHLLLVLPDPVHTFDHRRPITTIEHLREDEASGRQEDDLTHLVEVLTLHDLTRDAGAGSRSKFEQRCRENAKFRCLHHHVFDLDLIRRMLGETGWEVVAAEKLRPIHLVVWACATVR